MKKLIVILVAIISLCSMFSTYAQQSKLKIAVIDLDYGSGSGNSAMSLTSILTTELVNTKKYVVMERSSVQKIINELKLQSEQKASARAAEIGNLLGVHKIITGECVGDKVSLRLIDVESGAIEAAITTSKDAYVTYYKGWNPKGNKQVSESFSGRRRCVYPSDEEFARKLIDALLN
jgi:curli biogenesis system outer membrane secretion channel CsgG